MVTKIKIKNEKRVAREKKEEGIEKGKKKEESSERVKKKYYTMIVNKL